MNEKLAKLWETKNKDDEWWSSFVTSPLAILSNWVVVDWKWLNPSLVTLFSFITALCASALIITGGQTNFYIAAALINISHILDCMDGQMARYRGQSSRFGNYFDKVTDHIQIFCWFGAISYASYLQTESVLPVFLAFTGVYLYGLRSYTRYVSIVTEMSDNKEYLQLASDKKDAISERNTGIAGLDAGWKKNFKWLLKEQQKFFLFDEAVFVFMLSFSLIVNSILPMLWLFALSQVYYGMFRTWQRGHSIRHNQHIFFLGPVDR